MIDGIRLPIDWTAYGFPAALRAGPVVLWQGSRAWHWTGEGPPESTVREAGPPPVATPVEGWGIDHVVLLVPDLDEAAAAIEGVAGPSRRRTVVNDRPTAFWLVGTLLEVVEEATVDRHLLYGVSLTATEPLEQVADRWRRMGHDVRGPRDAVQPGRRILTVPSAGAGLAVMTPRRGGSGGRAVVRAGPPSGR